MIRSHLVIIAFAVGVTAQTVQGPELFARIRQHIRPSIVELPKYTCLETMDRTTYGSDGKLEFRERLRMDVLVADAKELFAWRGSGAFTDKPLENLIGEGTIFNGAFWIHLYNLFETSVATVKYAGHETNDPNALRRFDFHVSSLSSHYTIAIRGQSAITAYSGSFWVDRESLDLVRLEMHAEDIPPNLDCQRDFLSVIYHRVSLNAGERLLPSVAESSIVNRDGRESRDKVTFSDCRHYEAETKLSFDVPESQTAPSAALPAPKIELPSGISLVLKLEQPITMKDSAVGDPITARLEKAITSGQLHLPKGTKISGRLRRLEQHFQGRQRSTLVGFEFFGAEGPGSEVAFSAHLTGPRATAAQARMVDNMPEVRSGAPGLDIEDGGTSSGVGTFRVPGEALQLPRGFRTDWETQ